MKSEYKKRLEKKREENFAEAIGWVFLVIVWGFVMWLLLNVAFPALCNI